MSRSDTLVEDMSHGPAIMLCISNVVGFTYVDASRGGESTIAGVEISRADGNVIELTTPEEVDALISCLQTVRTEVWG